MKKLSYERIHQSQQCLSSLGTISYRSLFGGYSLAVEKVVFAMVSGGELYLRACEKSENYFAQKGAPALLCNKRGRQVALNYYRVDDTLWRDRDKLLSFSSAALVHAKCEKSLRRQRKRIKDLPNLSGSLEILLCEVGITDFYTLKKYGSKCCWLKLRNIKKSLSVRVLFALEGAISGVHEAALPQAIRQELMDWYRNYEQQQKA